MIRSILLVAGALSFLSFAQADKPNILFIAIDDQNDWIGCLEGHPQIQTPHIDGLAARGTLFTNAHCQAPLCNPSRTSLMTGLRPSTTGIYGLAPWFRNVETLRELVSLPQYLRRHGYAAYSTGKIYHGGYGRRPHKDDEFDQLGPAASVGAKPPQKLVDTPNPHPLVDWGVFPHADEEKGDYRVASWAVETLRSQPKQPFFLSVGFFLPHVPCYATQKWFDLYPEDEVQLPPYMRQDRDDVPRFSWYLHWKLPEPRQKYLVESGQWRNLVRSYLACTSFVDAQVGRVLAALEQQGYADNTVVVLWSDHGWHLGEKGITGKNSLWDRSTRVPLIFAGPGVAIGGKSAESVELLDIYPTLIELCGLPAKSNLDGISLVPQLQNAAAQRKRPAMTTHNPGNHAVRTKRWRYVRYADGSEELYDMQADPHEINNLAGKVELAGVRKELSAWLPSNDAPPAPGSAHRILTYDGETAVWEGEEIGENAPIPEL
ncbi:MAG: sulfatase [Blastopirellula sp. JB062]